jgi:transglutaminase-like putative cysteine protease
MPSLASFPAEFAPYLAATPIIAVDHPEIHRLAEALRAASDGSVTDIARRCFEYVRDQIRHSWDYRADAHNPLTCAAPQVLAERTGYCYAKSHLLAALLRANGIPAALCYQRLTLIPGGERYCLHGLNAVYLPEHGWYRIDARGNKPEVDARFTPPQEQLAFALDYPGEMDFPGLYPEPVLAIQDLLQRCTSVQQAMDEIPDATDLPPAPLNLPLKER